MNGAKSFLKPGDSVIVEATVSAVDASNDPPTAVLVFPGGADRAPCRVRQHDVLHFSRSPAVGDGHPGLKAGWQPPERPGGLDDSFLPVVWYCRDGSGVEFDFYSPKLRQWGVDFLASIAGDSGGYPDFEWPFVEPFIPTRQDWEAVGIYTLDVVNSSPRPPKPKHAHLKVGFQFPNLPDGFDQYCVIRWRDGLVRLDFLNSGTGALASEVCHDAHWMKYPEWPFMAGFTPGRQDWETIGFACLDF